MTGEQMSCRNRAHALKACRKDRSSWRDWDVRLLQPLSQLLANKRKFCCSACRLDAMAVDGPRFASKAADDGSPQLQISILITVLRNLGISTYNKITLGGSCSALFLQAILHFSLASQPASAFGVGARARRGRRAARACMRSPAGLRRRNSGD